MRQRTTPQRTTPQRTTPQRTTRQRTTRQRGVHLGALKGLLPIAVLLVLWQLLGSAHSPTLPVPSAWWQALEQLNDQGKLWAALRTTVLLFLAGLVLATLIGVVLGTALGASAHLTRSLSPLLEFLRTTPAPAVVPAAALLAGLNDRTAVGVIVFGAVWPVLLNTASARSALPQSRLNVARTLNMSWPARQWKIVLPSLLPGILTGVRVATPICLIMTLLADFLLTSGGLGELLVQLQQQFDAAGAFALLAVIGLVGLLLNAALATMEGLILRRWPPGTRR